MITVICGTNRADSYSEKIADQYINLLKKSSETEISYVKLADLPKDLCASDMYSEANQHPAITELQDKYMLVADKFIVISPEYNGSFPGILKFFIDAISIRKYKETFAGKKVMLVGVASGRAGNLRGMDHLTGIFNHVGSLVFPNKLPISNCKDVVDEKGEMKGEMKEGTIEAIQKQIDGFLKF